MSLTEILKFFSTISPWFVAKIFVLLIFIIYALFSGVIVRQTDLMNQVLEAKFSPIIRLIALIHLISVIFVFLISLFVL